MSKYSAKASPVTIAHILAAKHEQRKLSAITCYDAAFARLLDDSGIDIVLVGDSLGNVILGHENTIAVTLDDMVHHAAAVGRVLTRPFLCVDMPFMSYHVSVQQALENAALLVQKGAAQGVKLEGGRAICPQVKALVDAGIPVMGHLGLTPQSVHAIGGYKVQGRGEKAAQTMVEDALALQEAGAFAIVLEMVPMGLAEKLTRQLKIPTIGIGAGPGCDGQIIVLHDILGFDESFSPKFLKRYASLGKDIKAAVAQYDRDVKTGVFPTEANAFAD